MIDSVRSTVLGILNKNNYGFIPPSDFNLYAKQAQMEIFEGYFSDYNKAIVKENRRVSGTGYADQVKPIGENLELFSETKSLTRDTGNIFYLPSLTTTSDEAYVINKVMCYKSVSSVWVFMGKAEKVSQSIVDDLVSSNLTTPTEKYPIYSQDSLRITVYPSTYATQDSVKAQYFRYPKDPKWTYLSLSGGEPIFNASAADYQDFELPANEEYKLVIKILQYCGLSIREQEVTNYGMIQEQKEQASTNI